jgi:uncharacterized small protein (DUF1192 family)
MPPHTASVYDQPIPSEDIRFQFEIVKHLAESVRLQTEQIQALVSQSHTVMVKLERMEAKEIDTQVAELRAEIEVLKAAHNQRKGANSVFAAVWKSPAVAWIIGAAATAYALFSGRPHP